MKDPQNSANRDAVPRSQPKAAPADPEYTIDELASQSQVPSRTIRFYQSAGALHGPTIRGRVAYYGAAHLERLKLVADLQDRGLRIKAICELLGKIDKGELDLNEWLGLEAQLGSSWANESPRVVTQAELLELTGGRRPGLLAELVRHGLVERQGESFLVPSPGLLQACVRLESAGVALETAVGGMAIIQKHAARLAHQLAKYFFKHAADGFGHDASAKQLEEIFRTLRPVSQDALRLGFGQEMERELRKLVESGKSTKIPRRKRKKRG